MRSIWMFFLVAVLCWGCGGTAQKPLQTADDLVLDALMGTWHEVARLPLRFENNCVATSFFFSRTAVDSIRVESLCWYKHLHGPMRKGVSKGYVKDMAYPGELMVQFMGPFSYPYNVIYVDKNYRFALLGSPDRKYLWILSRVMQPSEDQMAMLVKQAEVNGFDSSAFIYPVQNSETHSGAQRNQRRGDRK